MNRQLPASLRPPPNYRMDILERRSKPLLIRLIREELPNVGFPGNIIEITLKNKYDNSLSEYIIYITNNRYCFSLISIPHPGVIRNLFTNSFIFEFPNKTELIHFINLKSNSYYIINITLHREDIRVSRSQRRSLHLLNLPFKRINRNLEQFREQFDLPYNEVVQVYNEESERSSQ